MPSRFNLYRWTRVIGILAFSLFHALTGALAHTQDLRVAAAADLQFAMEDLVAKYQAKTRQPVEVVYGSSGNFFVQIQNGAPFDLFFSADVAFPAKLVERGLADKQSLYCYALGRLAVWADPDEHLNVSTKGFQSLLDPRVRKIAIANPEHAPYGKAAIAALERAGIFDQIKSKLVYGENISQAAQFVQSRNAQAGIIALSLATSSAMQNGDRWVVPVKFHPPLEQSLVLLSASKHKRAAADFLEFVKSAEGRQILVHYGFNPESSATSGGTNP